MVDINGGDHWHTADLVRVKARSHYPIQANKAAEDSVYQSKNAPQRLWRFYGMVMPYLTGLVQNVTMAPTEDAKDRIIDQFLVYT